MTNEKIYATKEEAQEAAQRFYDDLSKSEKDAFFTDKKGNKYSDTYIRDNTQSEYFKKNSFTVIVRGYSGNEFKFTGYQSWFDESNMYGTPITKNWKRG